MNLPNFSASLLALINLMVIGTAAAGLVSNPSFEETYNPTFPHYGGNANWLGGSGSNRSDGPFHNGGTPIPDREQMAFLQGTTSLSQTIAGLTVGQTYWLQFFYDSRDCCGGRVIDLATKFDGTTMDTIANVTASTGGAPYKFRNVSFIPTATTTTLAFATTSSGDGTILLDAVNIVPAGQIVVMNPSFEATGNVVFPGYTTVVAGWARVGGGNAGVNTAAGPFADNGAIPEQDHAGFLQGDMTLSQTLTGLAVGETYSVSFKYNARTGNTPQLAVRVNGTSLFDQAVTPVGGVASFLAGSVNFTATAPTAVLSFAQTAVGDQTVLLDDIRVAGVVVVPPPNLQVGPNGLELTPGTRGAVSFIVSAERLANSASTVIVTTVNPGIATFVGANANGEITLSFPAGGPTTTLTAEVQGVARGTTQLSFVDNGGHVGVDGSVALNVVNSFVRNPSFEATGTNPGVGYGPIASWTNTLASSGLNNAGQPFFDNGSVPDRDLVAFLQGGNQVLSQQVSGLVPGQRYAVQAFYNARACCGGTIGFIVRFDGQDLATVPAVTAEGAGQPFAFLNASFTPTTNSGLLEFAATASGDASLLLDGINIVPQAQGELVVKNPSFEASGSVVYPGYTGALAGWTTSGPGPHGVNSDAGGPFSDNGLSGAQERVAFLQQAAGLSQVVDGLTAGGVYTLTYLVNARSADEAGPTPYRVLIDGVTVLTENQDPVGIGAPYAAKSIPFTANGSTVEIKFESTQSTGDQSLLLDDVHVYPGTGPVGVITLNIVVVGGSIVDISWPLSAPASLLLRGSPTMEQGTWQPVDSVPYVEGGMNHMVDIIDGPKKFYRLVQP